MLGCLPSTIGVFDGMGPLARDPIGRPAYGVSGVIARDS
jgi:hypothetical protein